MTEGHSIQTQGQSLAYIHLYRKFHGQGPSEHDLRQHFRVSLSTVHQMILKLEPLGLITREPGVARSVQVTIPAEPIPNVNEED
jgi:DNA-binding GntR family transcriptional regulator